MWFDSQVFDDTYPHYSKHKTPTDIEVISGDAEDTVNLVIPGYEKEDFRLFVENNWLKFTLDHKKKGKLTYSVFYGSASNFDGATASYKSGILKVVIPKILPKRKQIDIEVL